MPYIGKSPTQAVRQKYQYTATASQTTFSGSDANSLTLAYTDENYIDVTQNGVMLKGGGNDYTATTGTSVVLATGATANDVIEIIVYDVFAVADHVKKSGDIMTGSLDLNGTELVLDADGDTSITADTDDQIDIKVGGSDKVTIDSSGRVLIGTDSGDAFNDDSMLRLQRAGDRVFIHLKTDADQVSGILFGDVDDDVECGIEYEPANKALTFSTNNNTEAVRIDSSGNVGIGTSSINRALEISGDNNSGAKANYIRITDTDTTATASNQIGGIEFFSSDSSGGAGVSASIETIYAGSGGGGEITFNTNATSGGTLTERMRIDENGNLFVGKTSENAGTAGSEIKPVGGVFTADNDVPLVLNRNTTDGTVLLIKQANSSEGSISVSGSTVSFDGFVGRHESSGIATSVAKGTVVSTIDELDVYATGETKAGQTRANHAKVKVSDSVGDKRVYGVVDNYTEKDKVMVSSVGIASVKVTGACVGGDLLESNGDGTAKVQSDDIVRSKTIGKVTIGNSDTGVKLVSCVLYCG